MTLRKTFIFILFSCFNLFIQQAYADRTLLSYFHLINNECSPYGELRITEWDSSGEGQILFHQFPISLELPDVCDSSYNDVLIANICEQMTDLAKKYNVQSMDLFLHASKISVASFESISKLNGLHLLSLINLREIDRESLPYIEKLSDSTLFFFNDTKLTSEDFDMVYFYISD